MASLEHARASVYALGLVVLLGSVSVPSVSRASVTAVSLEWVRMEGAESCLSASALRAVVSRRLGRDPFRSDAGRIIEGVVSRSADRWLARIFVRSASGQPMGVRELSSSAVSCQALDAAVTLAVSLAIDPTAALTPPAQERSEELEATAPLPTVEAPSSGVNAGSCEPAEPCEEAAVAGVADVAGVVGELSAWGVFAVGLLPRPSAGVGVGGSVSLGRLRLELGMIFLPEVDAHDRDFSFGLTASRVALGVGFPFPSGRAELRLLAVGSAGTIHAVVRRYTPTAPGQRLWSAAGVGAELFSALLEHGFASLGAELLVPLLRHRFRVEGRPGTVFQQDRVALLVQLAFGAHFP